MGVAVMFPGQGSQSPGMGTPWQGAPEWALVERAEEVLGQEVAPLLLDGDPDRLRHTREAQLAVFLTSLLAWEAAKDMLGEITAFAGHSLGQVTALVAALASGVLTFLASERLGNVWVRLGLSVLAGVFVGAIFYTGLQALDVAQLAIAVAGVIIAAVALGLITMGLYRASSPPARPQRSEC